MSISLKENRHETLTAAQKETLEELRETSVPRYLFRGWHYGSGGGPKETINSTEEIIPHGSMNDREGHDFYELQESELKSMLECHYDGKTDIPSEISSWAASLMMIIFFAKRQQNLGYKVWHAPHLNQEFEGCIHEYFAHGPIRGPGDKDSLHSIAELFELFEMPVATALACARPRPWCYVNMPARLDAASRKALEREAVYLNIHYPQPADAHTAHWLLRGSVLTGPTPDQDFPDVRQWIDLLRVMAKKVHEREVKATMRGKKRKEMEDEEDWRPARRRKTRAK
ncbi:hypothetical protein Alg130_09475 [Pyrenophora tritici-repentis]|nr:hypothetical protein Alg130_09475 [Pyrenophora tritici-repentis]KAI0606325.1 hypothetical protein TUN205_09433 [Pyrenophora tritici-repentis]PZC91220.1 hypothetical protein A1F95_08915 [Pyrenophora tritici-repentis]PZD31942.1 hypothetical protein A1F96_03220 [Pyrenophora tritici-repentis]